MKTINLLLIASFFTVGAYAQPTQPGAPLAGNSSNCTAATSENCGIGSNVVTSFTGATLRAGSANSVGAVYSFYNVATVSGQQINATITIDATSNVSMSASNFSIDDDAATDQSGNSISSFFAPRITANSNLTTSDRRGYVQFTIRFYFSNATAGQQYPGDYTTVPPLGLSGLNYIHYDIDGEAVGTGGWFRETGVVKNVGSPVINADVSSELTAYNYTDVDSWRGFAGSVYERTGVSRCSQTIAAAYFPTPQTQVTFRMGYDYNYTNNNYNSAPTRQYGSRFGCFSFPQQTTLPVKLISFNGTFKNNSTQVAWVAENQVSFDHYELERSSDGNNFSLIAAKAATANNSSAKVQYNHNDDLAAASGNTFFYRLKMIDIDGTFKYSNVIMVRKDQKTIVGMTISPNPVTSGGMATVRFEASARTVVEFKVVDMAGKVILKQQNTVAEGTNSIAINNLDRLQPGMYVLQMNDGSSTTVSKLSIAR